MRTNEPSFDPPVGELGLAVGVQPRVGIDRVVGRPAHRHVARLVETLGVQHVVAEDAVEEDAEVETTPRNVDAQRGHPVGIRVADDAHVVLVDGLQSVAIVNIHILELTRLGVVARKAGAQALGQRLHDAVGLVAVEHVHRLPYGEDIRIGAELFALVAVIFILHAGPQVGFQTGLHGVSEAEHLVAVAREDEGAAHAPVAVLERHAVDRQFDAAVADLAVVDPHLVVTRRRRDVALAQQVRGALVIPVESHVQTVAEERHVQSEVDLRGGLPFQSLVRDAAPKRIDAVLPRVTRLIAGSDGRHPLASVEIFVLSVAAQRLVGRNALVARNTVGGADLQHVENVQVPDEPLLVHLPAERPRGEEGPLVVGAEFRRTVGAGREGEEEPVVERVVDTREGRDQLGLVGAVADRIGLRIARGEVLVAQRFVDEALGGQRRTARLVVLVRVTAHHRQPVLFSKGPIERGVGFENDVVVLPVADRPVTVVEHARLGILLREIFVGDLLAVLVVELRHDVQAGKHVPVHRSERDDV